MPSESVCSDWNGQCHLGKICVEMFQRMDQRDATQRTWLFENIGPEMGTTVFECILENVSNIWRRPNMWLLWGCFLYILGWKTFLKFFFLETNKCRKGDAAKAITLTAVHSFWLELNASHQDAFSFLGRSVHVGELEVNHKCFQPQSSTSVFMHDFISHTLGEKILRSMQKERITASSYMYTGIRAVLSSWARGKIIFTEVNGS